MGDEKIWILPPVFAKDKPENGTLKATACQGIADRIRHSASLAISSLLVMKKGIEPLAWGRSPKKIRLLH